MRFWVVLKASYTLTAGAHRVQVCRISEGRPAGRGVECPSPICPSFPAIRPDLRGQVRDAGIPLAHLNEPRVNRLDRAG